jgi:predicted porin
MKKVLLATTAIIAAGAFASPARAELEVTVGGFVGFQAAMFDNDVANNSDRDFQSEAQIIVHADATADNGLQYGAKVVLDASTDDSDNADEVGIYLAGNWGRVELGDDDGASELVVFAPTVGIGQINGSYDDFVSSGALAHGLNDRGDHNFTAIDTDDSTKVTYYTPKFSGFQAGVSYAPEIDNGENVVFTENSTTSNDNFEIGLGYEGEFNDVMVKVGGNYIFGDAGSATDEDVNAWSVGAQVGYRGFRLGGGYTDDGDSLGTAGTADDDITSWNVGLTYENGPWGVGVSYLDTDFDTNADGSTIGGGATGTGGDYTAWAFGGTYTVAPGLTVGADLAFFDRNATGTANDNDGYVAMTDVSAAF